MHENDRREGDRRVNPVYALDPDCRVRLCRPVGAQCPRCGRVVYPDPDREQKQVVSPVDHGI